MFTGLIEAVGDIIETKTTGSSLRLRIRTDLASELAPGDSLAVNGVCLTVVVAENGEVHADVGPETARVTTLGALRRTQTVNLERPVRADSRMGGHFVQGHVDGIGAVEDLRSQDDSNWVTISYPPPLAPYFIRRGSVAVDGVSLTLAGLSESQFDVMIIPFTWAHTSLRSLRIRDRVNLECDMIGKYVLRAAELAGIDPARRTGIKSH
jgi:riboflavin synthase